MNTNFFLLAVYFCLTCTEVRKVGALINVWFNLTVTFLFLADIQLYGLF